MIESVYLTRNEQADLSEVARAAYAAGVNATGHRAAAYAADPFGTPLPLASVRLIISGLRDWRESGVLPILPPRGRA